MLQDMIPSGTPFLSAEVVNEIKNTLKKLYGSLSEQVEVG